MIITQDRWSRKNFNTFSFTDLACYFTKGDIEFKGFNTKTGKDNSPTLFMYDNEVHDATGGATEGVMGLLIFDIDKKHLSDEDIEAIKAWKETGYLDKLKNIGSFFVSTSPSRGIKIFIDIEQYNLTQDKFADFYDFCSIILKDILKSNNDEFDFIPNIDPKMGSWKQATYLNSKMEFLFGLRFEESSFFMDYQEYNEAMKLEEDSLVVDTKKTYNMPRNGAFDLSSVAMAYGLTFGGECPFCEGQSVSKTTFTHDERSGRFKCFHGGCEVNGDHIDLAVAMEHKMAGKPIGKELLDGEPSKKPINKLTGVYAKKINERFGFEAITIKRNENKGKYMIDVNSGNKEFGELLDYIIMNDSSFYESDGLDLNVNPTRVLFFNNSRVGRLEATQLRIKMTNLNKVFYPSDTSTIKSTIMGYFQADKDLTDKERKILYQRTAVNLNKFLNAIATNHIEGKFFGYKPSTPPSLRVTYASHYVATGRYHALKYGMNILNISGLTDYVYRRKANFTPLSTSDKGFQMIEKMLDFYTNDDKDLKKSLKYYLLQNVHELRYINRCSLVLPNGEAGSGKTLFYNAFIEPIFSPLEACVSTIYTERFSSFKHETFVFYDESQATGSTSGDTLIARGIHNKQLHRAVTRCVEKKGEDIHNVVNVTKGIYASNTTPFYAEPEYNAVDGSMYLVLNPEKEKCIELTDYLKREGYEGVVDVCNQFLLAWCYNEDNVNDFLAQKQSGNNHRVGFYNPSRESNNILFKASQTSKQMAFMDLLREQISDAKEYEDDDIRKVYYNVLVEKGWLAGGFLMDKSNRIEFINFVRSLTNNKEIRSVEKRYNGRKLKVFVLDEKIKAELID